MSSYVKVIVLYIILILSLLAAGGCSTQTRITNTELKPEQQSINFQDKYADNSNLGDIYLALSFSGGGTRAAAFSYGILSELRDTYIDIDGRQIRLLDEIDHISSVSGGSFTAAYYGLFGDRIFEDFETAFLRQNIQKTLINSILNPINWFRLLSSGFDRTSLAVDYYDKYIFQQKTFADMSLQDGPFIQINATDLGTGQSFGFTQESFDLLCSDLSKFNVARAVAASSSVPVLFPSITLKNYAGCNINELSIIESMEIDATRDARVRKLAEDILSFSQKDRRKYIHLVDGGISDNLGLRAMFMRLFFLKEIAKNSGQSKNGLNQIPSRKVLIVVNAETDYTKTIEQKASAPSAGDTMHAVSAAQISRYNLETLIQFKQKIEEMKTRTSADGKQDNIHFIELKFTDIPDYRVRTIFNNMATSFALPDEQVDLIYENSRQLLKNSTEFQDFIRNLDQKVQ